MEYFLKKYVEMCKDEFVPLGFKRFRGNLYVRLINDMLQAFKLFRYDLGCGYGLCTIKFSINPLCAALEEDFIKFCGQKKEFTMLYGKYNKPKTMVTNITYIDNNNEIKEIDGECELVSWNDERPGEFVYYKCSEQDVDNCIIRLRDAMREKLIPYLEKTINCNSGFYAETEIEKNYLGFSDTLDGSKYMMALKIGNYNEYLSFLKRLEKCHKDSYECNINIGNFEPNSEQAENRIQCIKDIQKQIKLIENRDLCYIQNLIKTNEEITIENLKKAKVPLDKLKL